MEKNKYPILEFDPTREAFINPSLASKKHPRIPKNCIITYFHEVINKFLEDNIIEVMFRIPGENSYNVYKFVDEEIALIAGIVGAPACVGMAEEMIALGAKNIMFCGGGGALTKDMTLGKMLIVESAIRDEGTSYHYKAPSRYVDANPKTINKIKTALEALNLDYIIGRVWTTDAFYRETIKRIEQRKDEGALIVEMEQSAMLALAEFRNINYGAIIYAGDDLSSDVWDSRQWRGRPVRENLVYLCKTIVKSF